MLCPNCQALAPRDPFATGVRRCVRPGCGWVSSETPTADSEQPPDTQGDLFAQRHAHRRDPDTSHQAARSAQRSAETHRLLVFEILKQFGPLSVEEITPRAQLTGVGGSSGSAVGRRISDLHGDGLVRDSGQRHRNRTGRRAVRWEVVE